MKPMRLTLALIVGLTLYACSNAGSCPQSFVAEQWRGPANGVSNEILTQRYCMRESLMQEHLETGMSRQAVLDLLGPPNRARLTGEPNAVTYWMAGPFDFYELAIFFDDDGKLIEVKTLQS